MEKIPLVEESERRNEAASRIRNLLEASADKMDWQHQDHRRQAMAHDLGLPEESPWPEVVDAYISLDSHEPAPKDRTIESALDEVRETAS